MTYPLTPIPYSLGTANGLLAKTDKSMALHYLTQDIEDANVPSTQKTLVSEDGNVCFYYLRQVPNNFTEISSKIFDKMFGLGDVVFSTDMYDGRYKPRQNMIICCLI